MGGFGKSCAVLPPMVPPLVPITSGYVERLRISPSLLLAACALIPREKRIFEALAPTVRDGCRRDVFLSPTAHRRRQPHWKHMGGDRNTPLNMRGRRDRASQIKCTTTRLGRCQMGCSGLRTDVPLLCNFGEFCKSRRQKLDPEARDGFGTAGCAWHRRTATLWLENTKLSRNHVK